MVKTRLLSIFITVFLSGIAIDFLVNGVAKITWAWIYCGLYIGLAGAIYNYVHLSKFRPYSKRLIAAFLIGTVSGHLMFMSSTSSREYKMKILSLNPITLKADAFSEHLLLTSPSLSARLTPGSATELPVTLTFVKSYGCVIQYKLGDVAGIDFERDPESTWVWKKASDAGKPLDAENGRFFWCALRWY